MKVQNAVYAQLKRSVFFGFHQQQSDILNYAINLKLLKPIFFQLKDTYIASCEQSRPLSS